ITSLLLVLLIIFVVALVLHFILHKLVLPKLSKAISKYDQKWQLSFEINKLFSRFAFLIQGVVINIQALLWMGPGKTQEIW
ncbi:miniconductance mechanosensitive channel, partial [Klebsiella quasipneumoniae]|nr:miniconductance mechanosensitive channel [Klebsiella quasipneumoniae]